MVSEFFLMTSASASDKSVQKAYDYSFPQYNEELSQGLNKNAIAHIGQIHRLLTLAISGSPDDLDDVEMATTDGDDTTLDVYALRTRLLKKSKAALEFVASSLSVQSGSKSFVA